MVSPSASQSTIMFIVSGTLLLILTQLSSVSAGTCSSAPTITMAQYNQTKTGTTIAQMKTIMNGLGYLQTLEYTDPMYVSQNTLTYSYQGTNQVPANAGVPGQISSYAMFTFTASTQQLKYKVQYGLC